MGSLLGSFLQPWTAHGAANPRFQRRLARGFIHRAALVRTRGCGCSDRAISNFGGAGDFVDGFGRSRTFFVTGGATLAGLVALAVPLTGVTGLEGAAGCFGVEILGGVVTVAVAVDRALPLEFFTGAVFAILVWPSKSCTARRLPVRW